MQVFSLIAMLQLIAIGNAIFLSPKVYYSTEPGAQCQAQKALDSIDQFVNESLSMLINLPPPCSTCKWTKVAYLNMSDPSEQCPPSWRPYHNISDSGVRACGRQVTTSTTGGCNSQSYTVHQSYQRVYGKIIGYQIGSPDAFSQGHQQSSIDEPYVDGVSVTYGDPRKHIWTFVGGISETVVNALPSRSCPCALNGTDLEIPQEPPTFVGNNYFCESGNPNNTMAFQY